MGIIKYGPIVEDTQLIKGSRSLGYFSQSKKNIKVSKYLMKLKSVKDSFDIIGYIDSSDIFNSIVAIEKSQLLYTICTRIPIKIASIQDGNLIPLQNGLNNFENFKKSIEKDSLFDNLTDYIRFGGYEEILESLKGMLVISIIGKKSSGKSHLLNRLAGTRFDVAAESSTEGIWMGIGNIRETSLVVFDCEALFTIERSNQEEIKTCLFLSSISDLVILNSNLYSGKYINHIFNQFVSGAKKLNGKNLFNGYLDIAFRDVSDNLESEAMREFNRFILSILNTDIKQALLGLFNKNIRNSMYHYNKASLFENEIEEMRREYSEGITKKWPHDVNFGLIIKIILLQIFIDDDMSMDDRHFTAESRRLKLLNEVKQKIEANYRLSTKRID